MKRFLSLILLLGSTINITLAQQMQNIDWNTGRGLTVGSVSNTKGQAYKLKRRTPAFSFKLDGKLLTTASAEASRNDSGYVAVWSGLEAILTPNPSFNPGWKGALTFKNISEDTVVIENVVPFGESSNHVYITGKGNNYLSRTYLFRPDYSPVNVIVPDNAWELGYSGLHTEGKASICSLTRRTKSDKAEVHRFITRVAPGGRVSYDFYADFYTGKWQAGLREMFQDRYLYDIQNFDNSLFEREDLKWIRNAYVIHLMMAWDHQFYNRESGTYVLDKFLKRGNKLYGGDDVIGIWPTWPVLGLDPRNQWDLFRDLPGGLPKIKDLAQTARENGTKFFISFNPWDTSTRKEDMLAGMSRLIKRTSADGVVLDTKGSSSKALQEAADSVRNGVVMYSEGMAVPKDMQGIVSGRVHNALYYPPMLNLNKFIKPEFAIFRVANINKERIRREYALSFFNGYGTEVIYFSPGQPSWINKQYKFLGETTRILRENSSNFLEKAYTPLISTTRDSIFVNKWPRGDKTIYTVFSLIPEGFNGPLFRIKPEKGYHFVDLFNYCEIIPDTLNNQPYAPVDAAAFDKKYLGTNNEGAVDAIAKLPELLDVKLYGDKLTFSSPKGRTIKVWAGRPEYTKSPEIFDTHPKSIRLLDYFGRVEGKFVVQLFNNNDELLDERIVHIKPAQPRLASLVKPTKKVRRAPKGMVRIPSGSFTMNVDQGDNFIPYPTKGYPKEVNMDSFLMDKHPVTNAEFKEFLDATNYHPDNVINFLKNWTNDQYPEGKGKYPVTYVSYEDAKAYAKWAGKRLPTEAEWQYAAQTPKELIWPWGSGENIKTESKRITSTLEVKNIKGIDSTLCNIGNGHLYPVGKYSKGANPYGLTDLVGSVWQMTDDLYKNGSYSYIILKGGSYYKADSSWWYVQGGPQKLTYRQEWLRVSPGFERNATVGFRCVKDIN
ncbi:MAG: SUMF1/EgtB/PvdO family nonheme iron enzyme [Balneolaceae bacterium]|jgi:formylglycine-generating enzyme required for sulfatase activity